MTEFETIAAQAKASYASGWEHGVAAERNRLHALLEDVHGRIDPDAFPELTDRVEQELDGCETCDPHMEPEKDGEPRG